MGPTKGEPKLWPESASPSKDSQHLNIQAKPEMISFVIRAKSSTSKSEIPLDETFFAFSLNTLHQDVLTPNVAQKSNCCENYFNATEATLQILNLFFIL